MPGGIKISKPERLPKDNVSEPDLHSWWNELLNYLNQDDDFHLFKSKGIYSSWTAAEVDEDRVTAIHATDDATKLKNRQRQLNNYLTIIAGCCSKDQYMLVIRQATSLQWIWNELTVIYQHQHKGKDFLGIVDIQFNPEADTAISTYNSYRAKIMENLKPAGTHIEWKNTTIKTQESISPTFEDHILLTTLHLIDRRLPAKVREIYGPRIEKGKFLMDLKMDILTNVNKMLSDLDDDPDTQVNAVASESQSSYNVAFMRNSNRGSQRGRGRYRGSNGYQNSSRPQNTNSQFCRLCHLSRKPQSVILSHEIGDISCPSLSPRDKDGLKSKLSINAIQADEDDNDEQEIDEEEAMNKIAELHGYDPGETFSHKSSIKSVNTSIHVIKPVPSQILTVFQNDVPIHMDLDSGCWINSVKLSFAKQMNWKIHPNGQLAKIADGKTVLKSSGEIHESFNRNNWTVKFSAIVLENLHTDVIAGNNFFMDNYVKQDITKRTIIVHNKFVVPETNRNVALPTLPINSIVEIKQPAVILPNQEHTVKVPLENDKMVFVEPSPGAISNWPHPQICTVKENQINIINMSAEPVLLKRQHMAVKEIIENYDLDMKADYKINEVTAIDVNGLKHIEDIETNRNRLTPDQGLQLDTMLRKHNKVFNQDLSGGYNHHSGPHFCKLKFANLERPSSKKAICVQYNSHMNTLLQKVCDELTDSKVLGIPQHENVEVQYIMPCFLRKKQKAKDKAINELTTKDVRLVVNTCELSKFMKSLPAKVNKPQDVYNKLAKWKYIIKTDLYQGFFQNHMHKEAQKWCAILTPHGGIRFFKRGIQGLINQSEELDELLANVFRHLLTDGKLVKQADDLFIGGETVEEALKNFEEMLQVCDENNLKLSPSKTIMFPISVDIMSWIWNQGGTLSPSPHRKKALSMITESDLKTVRDVRSWVGLYKTFIYHTPNLTKIMDPFDKLVGDKESKDSIVWNDDLRKSLQEAKDHVEKISDVYLPHPDNQLIILTDGARTPPGVGFVLQAKDNLGAVRTVRYYSVKLKAHHLKWSPCEIEAVAFGTAIEAFYDIIKESSKPVIICPDSKPVCDATKMLQKGKFSLSPRIQTFLNNMGKIRCDVQHISGKTGHNQIADFQSRNTETCFAEICQLCNYVNQQSDTILDPKIGSLQHQIPYSNRQGWKSIQMQDKACILARNALSTGQLVSKKSGKVNTDARRIISQAKIAKDNLLIVPKSINMSTEKMERIVVPSAYNQALITQMHYKNDHPTKSQLKCMFDKYFFGLGINATLDRLYEECSLCNSMKKLPKQELFTTTTNASQPGTHFVADVMRRARQKVLVIRDQFSSYTLANFIENETTENLESALIKLLTPIRTKDLVIVRTDKATGFQKLAANKSLEDINVKIELAEDFNKNGTAVIDKGIQELEREITILHPKETPIDDKTLSKAILNLNDRLRRHGNLSARNILFARDEKVNINLHLDDKKIASEQLNTRQNANSRVAREHKIDDFEVGEPVMLRDNPKKHNVRDKFIVTDVSNDHIGMQKITNHLSSSNNSQLRSKQYRVPKHKLFKVRQFNYLPVNNPVNAKNKSKLDYHYDPVRRNDDSSDDDWSSDDNDKDNTAMENIENDENFVPTNEKVIPQNIAITSSPGSVDDYDTPEEDNVIVNDIDKVTISKTPRIRESWVLPKSTDHYRKISNARRQFAAAKIQNWFRKVIMQRRQIKNRLRKRNNPPEVFRDHIYNTTAEIVMSSTEERVILSEEDSYEWDHHTSCVDLSNNDMNDGFIASPLDLKFSFSEHDLDKVFDFSDVFPLQSTPNQDIPHVLNLDFDSSNYDPEKVYDFSKVLPLTSQAKKTRFQRFRHFLRKKLEVSGGGTPSKGLANLKRKWGTSNSILPK